MATEEVVFESGHDDLIHDAQLDYFGSTLATASADRSIKIFDVSGKQHAHVADLKGHDGPVWSVAWSHPQFESLLASCSYDGRVIIWKNEGGASWPRVHTSDSAQSSVNSVAWGPPEHGLQLLACSSDNFVSVYTYADGAWKEARFSAHLGGVNAGSWAPAGPLRFVTGGNDNQLRMWQRQGEQWVEARGIFGDDPHHRDWVRDVAWAPSVGLPSNLIASCSEDQTVAIWVEDPQTGAWRKAKTLQFEHKVWRVSWSVMGNILAVSQGDNKVSLWKEDLDGNWNELTTVDSQNQQS
ncbi:WD domain, G-beta repeat [Plasmodiophora brassicae]